MDFTTVTLNTFCLLLDTLLHSSPEISNDTEYKVLTKEEYESRLQN